MPHRPYPNGARRAALVLAPLLSACEPFKIGPTTDTADTGDAVSTEDVSNTPCDEGEGLLVVSNYSGVRIDFLIQCDLVEEDCYDLLASDVLSDGDEVQTCLTVGPWLTEVIDARDHCGWTDYTIHEDEESDIKVTELPGDWSWDDMSCD